MAIYEGRPVKFHEHSNRHGEYVKPFKPRGIKRTYREYVWWYQGGSVIHAERKMSIRQISAPAAVLTDEQEELMEMIDVTATQQGIVQTLINQGKEIGSDNGKRELISNLLSSHSLDEVALFFHMSKKDIIEILEK